MKVKFIPQNVELEIGPSQSVLELAHANNIPIHSTCNGMPSCAECRVRVVDGEYNLMPPSKKELSLIGTGYYIDQRRLSCQMHCFGDITVDTTEHLERASEGPITKKFLNRVQKTSPQESHSVGGILIEQEEEVMKEISESVRPETSRPSSGSGEGNADFLGDAPSAGGGGGRRPRSGGGNQSGPRAAANARENARSAGLANQNARGSGGGNQGPRSSGGGGQGARQNQGPRQAAGPNGGGSKPIDPGAPTSGSGGGGRSRGGRGRGRRR